MPETQAHKRAKKKATGRKGKTEILLRGGGRLDTASSVRATEIERSGNLKSLIKAAKLASKFLLHKFIRREQQNG